MSDPKLTPGSAGCRCRACGEYFKNTRAFERHRVGEFTPSPPDYGRRCLTPDEMRARAWEYVGRGYWTNDSTLKRPRKTLRARQAGE